jgi:hypothetical protein
MYSNLPFYGELQMRNISLVAPYITIHLTLLTWNSSLGQPWSRKNIFNMLKPPNIKWHRESIKL